MKALTTFLVLLASSMVIYLAVSFYYWDTNPGNWTDTGRGFLSGLVVVLNILATTLAHGINQEEKRGPYNNYDE